MGDEHKYSYEDLYSMPSDKVDRLFTEEIISEGLYYGFKRYRDNRSSSVVSNKKSIEGVVSNYAPYELGSKAVKYILEDDMLHEDALVKTIEELGETLEWLKEVRNKPYYKEHSKKIISEYKEHPQKKVMVGNGTWDNQSFKESNTVGKLTKRVGRSRVLSNTIESLKESTEELEMKVTSLEGRSGIYEASLGKIESMQGFELLDKKEKALILFESGMSRKNIAEYLGVRYRTITRYISE